MLDHCSNNINMWAPFQQNRQTKVSAVALYIYIIYIYAQYKRNSELNEFV